jgi:hypothetical protein
MSLNIKNNIITLIKKTLIVLIPCWIVAVLTEQMVFVLPMVVVTSMWAMTIKTKEKSKHLGEFAMGRNKPTVDDDG